MTMGGQVEAEVDALRQELLDITSLDTSRLFTRNLANLPTAGIRDGAMAWVSDGRKQGEGAAAGTGILAYFNESTSTWKAFSDDADAAV